MPDIEIERFKGLAALLPLASVLTIVASIIYLDGFFVTFSTEWVRLLTVRDILTTCWPILPFVLLGIAVQGIQGSNPLTAISGHAQSRSTNITQPTLGAIYRIIIVFGYFSPVSAAIASPLLSLSLYLIFKIGFAAVLAHIICTPLVFSSLNAEQKAAIRPYGLLFNLLILVFWGGAMQGMLLAMSNPIYLVKLDAGNKVCTTILHTGERGIIIFDVHTKSSSYIPWSHVDEITRQSSACKSSIPQTQKPNTTRNKEHTPAKAQPSITIKAAPTASSKPPTYTPSAKPS